MNAVPATLRGHIAEPEPWFGYIRVSLWREQKISPEIQRGVIEAWADRTGRHIVDWVVELDVSGRHFRRKIMGLIERVEAGEARGIAVWKFSRFGRHNAGVQINLARLEAAGGELQSATEEVDAHTAIGGLQRDIAFAFAAFESRRAGEQWKETHAYRRDELGLPATGRQRFGYIWHPKRVPDPESPTGWRLQEEHYSINPQWQEIIADAYDDKIDPILRATFRGIGGEWNTLGARSTRGGYWEEASVRRYMDSGWAAGLLHVHDTDCRCGRTSTCKRYHYIQGAHDAIIDPDVWEQYLKHRAETKITPPRRRQPSYALASLPAHGHCRRSLHVVPGYLGKQYVPGYTYRCPYSAATSRVACPGVYIPRHTLERLVLDWLHEEHLADEADQLATQPVPPRPERIDPRILAARERARIEDELAKVTSALGRLAADRAIDPDSMTPEVYAAARARIADREAALRTSLDRVAVAEKVPERRDFTRYIKGLLAEWDTVGVSEQNAMLRTVIRRVVVHRVERVGQRATARIEVHPVWEPDPWEKPAGQA